MNSPASTTDLRYYHVTWGTKVRRPVLQKEVRDQLLTHIREYAAKHSIKVITTGAWLQHVHVLLALRPEQDLSEVVQRLKGESSHWLNRTCDFPVKFRWQHRYWSQRIAGAAIKRVHVYIDNQESHHSKG